MKQTRRVPAPSTALPAPVTDRSFTRQAAVIFIVALLLRLAHVWRLRSSPFFDVLLGDASGYDEWARRIAAGEWIGHDVFYQAPLYPYFLGVLYSLFGHDLLIVRLAQALIGALSCAFLGFAGRRFFSDRVGLVAGLALAVYAPAIFFDGLLQKAVLDLFFMTVALWLLGRLVDAPADRRGWLLLGVAIGALSLTRENALVLIAVVLGWCVANRGAIGSKPMPVPLRLRAATMFGIGLAIVLMPVAVRNYSVGGGFYLTTSQFGPNFFIGNNPNADGTYMSLRYGRGAPEYERIDATELAEHALGRSLSPSEVSSYWTGRALDFITGQPAQWGRLMARKAALLVNATEMLDTESQESYADYSWPLRTLSRFGHFGLLVPLGALGAIVSWPRRRRLAILYVLVPAYSSSVVAFYVFARYRLPLVPLLWLFAAAALVWCAERVTAIQRGGQMLPYRGPVVAGYVALVGALAVLANWPILSKPLMKAITETNLGTALKEQNRLSEAAEHYQRAIQIQPDYAPAHNNLGVALREMGEVDQAIRSYRQALATKGDYPDAHYNLANALLERNQPVEAAEHFNIALKSIPDSAGVRNNLGIALSAQGKQQDAIAAFQSAVAAEPDSATAHRNLGGALSDAGRTPEAIAALRRAIQLDPRDSAAHYNLGVIMLESGRLPDAIAEFRSALAIDPGSAETHNNLGIALGSEGRFDEAIDQFKQALALNPSFQDAQRNLQVASSALPQVRTRK